MYKCFSAWIAVSVCTLVLAISPTRCYAQYEEIDRLGKDLATAGMHVGPIGQMMAVADLQDTGGADNDQGHYFSLFVTAAINFHSKTGFAVADHNDFDSALEKNHISRRSLATAQSVTAVAGKINLGTIVTGDFQRDKSKYLLHLSVMRVSDGAVLYTTDAHFRSDDFVDSLAKPFPPPGIGEPLRLKKGSVPDEVVPDGILPPHCERCDIPTYNSAARAAGLQGTVIFEPLISPDGKVLALNPTKVLGFGLDEAAYELIMKRWRMKPARDKAGNPILVLVPIEVTFRLY